MLLSDKVRSAMEQTSWIRRMFEAADELRKTLGTENVFDLSLGNPVSEPPEEFKNELRKITSSPPPGIHRYMPNAGYTRTREAVARQLNMELGIAFRARDIVMTCGAAGAINVVLKTILNPGEEVMVMSPYFPEYLSYIDNHGGVVKIVPGETDFIPSIDAVDKAISKTTRAIIINSPNNPTGVVYDKNFLENLGGLLKSRSDLYGRPIFLISDEPYRRIVYDGCFASPLTSYSHAIIAASYSKDLSIPGERIGYIAVNPAIEGREDLVAGFIFSNRILGYVNAPALMQNIVTGIQGAIVDVESYRTKRDYLYNSLVDTGFDPVKPGGAFYMFPAVSGGDDIGFVNLLMDYGVLAVPGCGFGAPGYIRLSYCVDDATLEGAVSGIKKAYEKRTRRSI